jgi:hypothetical protein
VAAQPVDLNDEPPSVTTAVGIVDTVNEPVRQYKRSLA